MLTEEKKTALKVRLEEEKNTLEVELERLGARNPSNSADWVAALPEGEEFGADRTDNAGVIEEIQGNYATLNELEGRLNTVLRALDKMKSGTYGFCEISGDPIELERLEANPAARTAKAHMGEEEKLPR